MAKANHDLEACCQTIAEKMKRVNPDWGRLMHAAMEEHGWNFTQAVGACIAYVYERGLHMTIPRDEFFKPETPDTHETEYCIREGCGKAFTPRWPQDKFCSNECGVLALPKRKVKGQPVIPDVVTDAACC